LLGVALRYWPMTLRAGALRPSHSSALVPCASARHCACRLGHLSVRVLSVFCCALRISNVDTCRKEVDRPGVLRASVGARCPLGHP
jgi:hypothetical protein